MSKHTPGPYFLRGHAIESDRETVAVITKLLRERDPEQAEATGRLLAAAPRLLDAAYIGWDALSDLLESYDSTLSAHDREDAQAALDKFLRINHDLKGLILEEYDQAT